MKSKLSKRNEFIALTFIRKKMKIWILKSIVLIASLTSTFTVVKSQSIQDRKKIVDSLYHLPENEFYTSKTLKKLGWVLSSSDKAFNLYYPKGEKIDSVVGIYDLKRSSVHIITKVIMEEDILPEIDKDGHLQFLNTIFLPTIVRVSNDKTSLKEPNWNRIEKKISVKYNNSLSKRAVLRAQIDFYRANTEYNKLTAAYLNYVHIFGNSVDAIVNNVAFEDILTHVTDKRLLKKVAVAYRRVMEDTDKENPNFIDTYANLLYKSGDVNGAINFQKKAILLTKNVNLKKILNETLVKMQKGISTWQ